MNRLLLMTALVPVALIGCQSKVDVESEKATIQKIALDWAKATSKGGAEGAKGYASYVTADARWLPPELPAIAGRDAIETFVATYTEMPEFEVTWDDPHVVVSRAGDIAYSIGTYQGSGLDAEGTRQPFEGKRVTIWHKQPDGSWKVAVGIWNTDEPATPPAPDQQGAAESE